MSDQRFPINIRPIGVMHKTKAKKLYMTSVLWSDDSDIIVYRSSQDFKQLHKQLKKRFRAEGGTPGRSKRLIPKFKAGTVQVNRKGPDKTMLRLKYLEKYFDQLLKCDPQITQSAELAQFFLPNAQDLEPEFSKNCLVVMPSEDLQDGGDQPARGNVSQPFVSEVYRCVAEYETKDTKNRAFKVAVDEKVDVLIKDKAGWWLVENGNKCMAWFPAPYLEKCDEEEDEVDEGSQTPEEGVLYCALKSFTSSKDDEVSVSIGAVVEVLQKSDNGWWLIRYKGKVGYVPAMYLRPYKNPKVRFATMAKELRSSALNLAQLQVPAVPPATGRGSHGDLTAPGNSPTNRRLSEPGRAWRSMPSSPEPRPHTAVPIIRVQEEEEEGTRGAERAWSADRQASLGSEWGSDGSSASELNLSDDSAGSPTAETWRPRTPQRLAVAPDDRLAHASSETNLFKGPVAVVPKVPPRPHAQEILSRCTTITRRAAQSPARTRVALGAGLIQSR